MLIRKDAEIAQFGHVISSGYGDVTGWKRHQKLVAEIQLGNFFLIWRTLMLSSGGHYVSLCHLGSTDS